jgi:hypothetical protein
MKFPHSQAVTDLIVARQPMHRKFLTTSINRLTEEERLEAEQYLAYLNQQNHSYEDIAAAYLTIVIDTFKEELMFRETGRYRCSSYAEAAEAVYDNPDYMRHYMVGLALTSFWWANHAQMRRFFLQHLPANLKGSYLEVGPGHGLYFMDAMRKTSCDGFTGVDISETSTALTSNLINSGFFGDFPKPSLITADFFTFEPETPAAALVMGEVLEHVEAPGRFLERAHAVTNDDPFIFLTTCINSPAIDHIYNPENFENLEALINQTGFKVTHSLLTPLADKSLEECWQQRLGVNVALLLSK